MDDLTDLREIGVHLLADPPRDPTPVAELRQRARRRRFRRRGALIATASSVLLVLASVALRSVFTGDASRRKDVVVGTDGRQGLFSSDVNVGLVFDDGGNGILIVEPDRRMAARRIVEGQRAGDQPYRLVRVGDALVVGWGEVYAAPLDGGPSHLLGESTIFIPAAEPERLWLVDYPGHVQGSGTATYRQVDMSGREIVEFQGLSQEEGFPGHGVPNGVALETLSGVAIVDAATGEIATRYGTRSAFVSDVASNSLAWCEDLCRTMHVTNVMTGDDLAVAVPENLDGYNAREARFSPDGSRLAALAGDDGPTGPDTKAALVIIDVDTGSADVVSEKALPTPAAVAWSPDGTQVFATTNSYDAPETTIGWHRAGSDTTEIATLPIGGALRPVIVNTDEAAGFIPEEQGVEEQCPPSGTSSPCAFGF